MRTAFRLLAVPVALAAATLPHSATAQDDVRGILFSTEVTEEGGAMLTPIALLLREGFARPGDGPDADEYMEFNTRWLEPGTRYDLLSRGERVGTTSVTHHQSAPEGCVGTTAWSTLQVRALLPQNWRGLAGEGLPRQPNAPWLRNTTADELRALDRLAAALFAAHGVDVARYTQADTSAATLLHGPGERPVLVGEYVLQRPGTLTRQASVFVIAEEGENGYRPAFAWFDEEDEGGTETRTLVDAADLDGDGRPELVVRNFFYEHWTYTIFSRTPDGWREVYNGGGGGC